MHLSYNVCNLIRNHFLTHAIPYQSVNPTKTLYCLMAINVASDSVFAVEFRILEVRLLLLISQTKKEFARVRERFVCQ